MGTYCTHCSEKIVKGPEDEYKDWRHQETRSMFCAKVRGKKITSAEPRPHDDDAQ